MHKNDSAWLFGANFTPSNAINQLEMWQEETFDPALIDRELGYAQGIGMNVMRVYLHDLLWKQDAPGFLRRMERYLEIADSHGIRTGFVFFDDCWKENFALGTQPAPKPFTHNSGWIQSPGRAAADNLPIRAVQARGAGERADRGGGKIAKFRHKAPCSRNFREGIYFIMKAYIRFETTCAR